MGKACRESDPLWGQREVNAQGDEGPALLPLKIDVDPGRL
jgi:hypothetical protein